MVFMVMENCFEHSSLVLRPSESVFLALDVTIFGQKGGATSCIMLRRRHLKHNLGFTEVIHLMARVSTIITTRSEDIKTEGTKVN